MAKSLPLSACLAEAVLTVGGPVFAAFAPLQRKCLLFGWTGTVGLPNLIKEKGLIVRPIAVGQVGVSGVDGSDCGVRGINLNNVAANARWNFGAAQSYKEKKGLIVDPIAVGLFGAAVSSGIRCGVRALDLNNPVVYANWRYGAAHSYR